MQPLGDGFTTSMCGTSQSTCGGFMDRARRLTACFDSWFLAPMRAHTNSRITRYASTNDSKDIAAFAGLVEGREIQARDSLVERLAES